MSQNVIEYIFVLYFRILCLIETWRECVHILITSVSFLCLEGNSVLVDSSLADCQLNICYKTMKLSHSLIIIARDYSRNRFQYRMFTYLVFWSERCFSLFFVSSNELNIMYT